MLNLRISSFHDEVKALDQVTEVCALWSCRGHAHVQRQGCPMATPAGAGRRGGGPCEKGCQFSKEQRHCSRCKIAQTHAALRAPKIAGNSAHVPGLVTWQCFLKTGRAVSFVYTVCLHAAGAKAIATVRITLG